VIKLEGPNFICISIKIIREQFFFDGATTYIVQSEIIASFIKLEQMPQGIIFCICIKLIRANRYRWYSSSSGSFNNGEAWVVKIVW
jgi:hypothetical protein